MLLLSLLLSPPAASAASPAATPPALRIGVLVMQPGEAFWERFGHDAILVEDRAAGTATSYNFGFFDMGEAGFVGNFVRGRMRYYLVALPLADDMDSYREEGRGVGVQWLDLDPALAAALEHDLAVNARPENARYRYDYYLDNCSTRVRDALDRALGGALKRQLSGRSRGNSWRSESVRLAWPAKWMAFSFHLGLAGIADRPLSRWDEAFIPMRLRESLREARRADGKPLVLGEETLLTHRLSLPPEEMPRWRVPALFIGLGLAVGVSLLGKRRPRLLAGLALPLWIFAGLAGALMAFIWFGTAHLAGHGNENLLLLSPLAFALLPGGWRVARGRDGGRVFRIGLWALAGMAAIAGFLKFLPFRPQENVEWVLLLLPVHLALARVFSPREANLR
ncbi:MAG: DUF4105 domain-containing protein [Arenimonas sp.]